MEYLMDTNVVSYFLENRYSETALGFMRPVMNDIPKLSIITKIELSSWKTSRKTEKIISSFISDSSIIPLTNEIAERTIDIRRKYSIKTPDVIIAATAIHYGLTLLSNDIAGFSNIQGLTVVIPMHL